MKKFLIVFAVIFVILLIVAFSVFSWIKGTYNNIVTMDEEIKGTWGQLENVLQRRFDLIPNLVATVKGYASHENEVLTQVTEARAKVGGAGTPSARMEAEGELSSALSRLMVVVENYPNLKANQNFIMLQDQLEGTENRIAVERGRYITAVKAYNQFIRKFPANMIANAFNFTVKDTFEASDGAQTAPEVKFD
ncbi:MAG: LemA family protein [Candidatus Latescibacteria bacterium]|nr:LemA family protein [Candidatus Latescibacterota bacterium]